MMSVGSNYPHHGPLDKWRVLHFSSFYCPECHAPLVIFTNLISSQKLLCSQYNYPAKGEIKVFSDENPPAALSGEERLQPWFPSKSTAPNVA